MTSPKIFLLVSRSRILALLVFRFLWLTWNKLDPKEITGLASHKHKMERSNGGKFVEIFHFWQYSRPPAFRYRQINALIRFWRFTHVICSFSICFKPCAFGIICFHFTLILQKVAVRYAINVLTQNDECVKASLTTTHDNIALNVCCLKGINC